MKRRSFTSLSLAVMALGVMLAAVGGPAAAADPGKGAQRLLPVVKIYRGEKCVEPTEVMRRDHMEFILHQRDKTVHGGIRTVKHSLRECINCHADPASNSVLGKEGFCQSCHSYAAVTMDCFSCHTDKAEKDAKVPPLRTGAAVPDYLNRLASRPKHGTPKP